MELPHPGDICFIDHESKRDAFAGEIFVVQVASEVIYGVPCDPRMDLGVIQFSAQDGWRILSKRRDSQVAQLMLERLANTIKLSKDNDQIARAKYLYGLMSSIVKQWDRKEDGKGRPELELPVPRDDVEIEEGDDNVLAVITIPAKEIRIKIYDLGMEEMYAQE